MVLSWLATSVEGVRSKVDVLFQDVDLIVETATRSPMP
jgi:hypothetical protein